MFFLTDNPSRETCWRWKKRVPHRAIRWNRVLEILMGGGCFTTRELAQLLGVKYESNSNVCGSFIAWASFKVPLVSERRGSTNYYWVEKPIKKKQGEKI